MNLMAINYSLGHDHFVTVYDECVQAAHYSGKMILIKVQSFCLL